MSTHGDAVGTTNHAITANPNETGAAYADIAARDADTAFNTNVKNVNKVVRVNTLPESSFYILVTIDPTWHRLDAGGNDEWIELTDTPSFISAGLVVQGNVGGTALEFGQALRATDSPAFAALTLDQLNVLNVGSGADPTLTSNDVNQLLLLTGRLDTSALLRVATQATIGSLADPAADVSLFLSDPTKAALLNQGTTIQKDAIAATFGMLYGDTDLGDLQFFDGMAWLGLGGGDISGPAVSVIDSVSTFATTGGKNLQDPNMLFLVAGKAGLNIDSPVSTFHLVETGVGFGVANGLTIEHTNSSGAALLHIKDFFAEFTIGTDFDDNSLYITPGSFINVNLGMNIDRVTGFASFGNVTGGSHQVNVSGNTNTTSLSVVNDATVSGDLTVQTDGNLGFGFNFFTQDIILGAILQLTDPKFTIVYDGLASLDQLGTSSTVGILSANQMFGQDSIGNTRVYGALETFIEDNLNTNFTGSIRLAVTHQGNPILQPILGVNVNSQKEVFIYDNIRFNNLSTGADPVLTANATDQTLSLTGDFDLGTNTLKFADGSLITSANDIFHFHSDDSFLFHTDQATFFTIQFQAETNTPGIIGSLDFVARDSLGSFALYSSIDSAIVDPANGVETGAVIVSVTKDGVISTPVAGFNELDRLETRIHHDLQIVNQGVGADPIFSSNNATRPELELLGDLNIGGNSPILAIRSGGDFQQANFKLLGSRDQGGADLAQISAFNFRSTVDIEVARIAFVPAAIGTSSGEIVLSTKTETGVLTERVRINAAGNVGIGVTNPITPIHIRSGSAGGVSAVVDGVLTLESNTDVFLSFLTPAQSGIFFGDQTNNKLGAILYDTATVGNGLDFRVNGLGTKMVLNSLGNVGIGVITPNAVALLDMVSTTKGFLKPRMSPANRDVIPTPPAGLELFNDINVRPEWFDGVDWRSGTDPVNVIPISSQTDWDDLAVAGTITIAVDTTLFIKTTITTSDAIVVNAGVRFSILGSRISSAGIIYTGGATFITSDGVLFLRVDGINNMNGSSTGTLFSIINSPVFLELSASGYFNWASLGTIENSAQFKVLSVGFFNSASGFIFDQVGKLLLNLVTVSQTTVALGDSLFKIRNDFTDGKDATISAVINSTNATLGFTDTLLEISPDIGFSSTSIVTSNIIAGGGGLFKPNGILQTVSNIVTSPIVTGTTFTSASSVFNGDATRFETPASNNLAVGQTVEILGASVYDGLHRVIGTDGSLFFEIDQDFAGTATGSMVANAIECTDAAHGFSDGAFVQLVDTDAYDGFSEVFNTTVNTFEVSSDFFFNSSGSVRVANTLTGLDPRITVRDNPSFTDSQNIGAGFVNNNTTPNPAITNDVFTDMAFGAAGIGLKATSDLSRWRLVDRVNGTFKYIGVESFRGTLSYDFTSVSSGGAQEFRFKWVHNAGLGFVDLPDAVESLMEIGSTASSVSKKQALGVNPGDLIKPRVTRNAGTSTITTSYATINATE